MTHPIDRRKPPPQPLAQVHERSWHLPVLTISVCSLLVAGTAAFFYPAIIARLYDFDDRMGGVLPQLVIGMMALILSQAAYIAVKRQEVGELRNFIMATYASDDVGLLGAEFPRDPLTAALDRRALPDILRRETTWVDRYRIPLCLALLDIRNFKTINEKEGNMGGDLLLKEFAQTIQATMRQTDSIVRYGPDEFLCLLPRTNSQGAEAFIRRIMQACQSSARLHNLVFDSGTGVYEAGADVNRILTSAEQKLTDQKQSPRPGG